MGKGIVTALNSTGGGGGNLPPLFIFTASDFPTVDQANHEMGRLLTMVNDVTDNDPTKTDTGEIFISGQEAKWTGSSYIVVGDKALWFETGSDIKTVNAKNIDLGANGLKDDYATTAILLADSSNTSFSTTNKTIVGAVNELAAGAVSTFLGLTDTPSSYATAYSVYQVNAAMTGVVESAMTIDSSSAWIKNLPLRLDDGTNSWYTKVLSANSNYQISTSTATRFDIDYAGDTTSFYNAAGTAFFVLGTGTGASTFQTTSNRFDFYNNINVLGESSAYNLALIPQGSAPSTSDGVAYYDSGTNKFLFRENGAWQSLGDSSIWDRKTSPSTYIIPDTVTDPIGATAERISKIWSSDLESTIGKIGTLSLDTGTSVDEISTDDTGSGATDDQLWARLSCKTYIDSQIAATSGIVVKDLTSVITDGKTSFTLANIPIDPSQSLLSWNGQLQRYGSSPTGDYTITGNTLTWNNRKGQLSATNGDELFIAYDITLAPPLTQSSFQCVTTSQKANITGNAGVPYHFIPDVTNINVGSDFDSITGQYTAPVAGSYLFTTSYDISGITSSNNLLYTSFEVIGISGHPILKVNPAPIKYTDRIGGSGAVEIYLTAGQKVRFAILGDGETTANMNLESGAIFSGRLVEKA